MASSEEDKDKLIALLKAEAESLKESVSILQGALIRSQDSSTTFYASTLSQLTNHVHDIPEYGMPARYVKEVIEQIHLCDFRPRLNTSSYVNVVSDPEEKQVAILGAEVNLADVSTCIQVCMCCLVLLFHPCSCLLSV